MGDAVAFIGQIIFRLFLEALLEGFGYALKRIWFALAGRKERGLRALEMHRGAQTARRAKVEELRARRNLKRRQH